MPHNPITGFLFFLFGAALVILVIHFWEKSTEKEKKTGEKTPKRDLFFTLAAVFAVLFVLWLASKILYY